MAPPFTDYLTATMMFWEMFSFGKDVGAHLYPIVIQAVSEKHNFFPQAKWLRPPIVGIFGSRSKENKNSFVFCINKIGTIIFITLVL